MSEADLDLLRRACAESPRDLDAWARLARALDRHDRLDPGFAGTHLQGLLGALALAPGDPALTGLALRTLGLERVDPVQLDQLQGSFWLESERTEPSPHGWYDRVTGLPIGALRSEDQQLLELVPAAVLVIEELPPYPPLETRVQPGYVARERGTPALLRPLGAEAGEVGHEDAGEGEGRLETGEGAGEGAPEAEAVAPPGAAPLPRFQARRVEVRAAHHRAGGVTLPIPPEQDQPHPLSEVLGPFLAHGLRPLDCGPLPPRAEPKLFPGLPEPIRLAGAQPPVRSGLGDFVDWVKGWFED